MMVWGRIPSAVQGHWPITVMGQAHLKLKIFLAFGVKKECIKLHPMYFAISLYNVAKLLLYLPCLQRKAVKYWSSALVWCVCLSVCLSRTYVLTLLRAACCCSVVTLLRSIDYSWALIFKPTHQGEAPTR